ncbi:ABC transporter permease [Jannaschia formosa]|uniref:ABC transporter permease n=1 Tax=Jannaschia formosa TaxID=2259592 RepID=UPI000E1C08FA|nr:ABC transporter permease [Jannaschia formosa]TFL20263.1 ABC transporter permease [Jannaschia formosa]
MWVYAAKRVLYAIPIAIGVSVICFSLVYLAPGDPIQSLIPPDATAEDIETIRRLYGFDKPLVLQYLDWLARALTGDLGISLQSNRPVIDEVTRALGNTLAIAIAAILAAFVLATILGTLAAFNLGRPIDKIATSISTIGVSVPNYWMGIVLVILFAVQWRLLPATGMGGEGSEHFSWLQWDQARYAILPMVTMAMIPLGVVTRSTRSAVADTLSQDYVQLLRAKGLGEMQVVCHALRNALPQMLAVMGLQLGYLIGGSILIETVFNWPGTGLVMSRAILTRDIPLLQGTILVLALSFVAINLIVDLLQTVIDPRIKRA